MKELLNPILENFNLKINKNNQLELIEFPEFFKGSGIESTTVDLNDLLNQKFSYENFYEIFERIIHEYSEKVFVADKVDIEKIINYILSIADEALNARK